MLSSPTEQCLPKGETREITIRLIGASQTSPPKKDIGRSNDIPRKIVAFWKECNEADEGPRKRRPVEHCRDKPMRKMWKKSGQLAGVFDIPNASNGCAKDTADWNAWFLKDDHH